MVVLFVLDVMPESATFQNALLNVIVEEHPDLWSEVRLCIIDDRICYELWVFQTTTGTLVNC